MEKKLLALVMVFVMASSVHAITITWTTVDYPGSSYTCISDIDGSNFVGIYDKEGIIGYPSFLYDGTWTPLDLPGAPTGISGGNIVGTYVISATLHGFIYDGTDWTTLDYPGASGTWVEGIGGDNIVGYTDSHGVIYNLDSQTWTTLDYPDPGASWTRITDIDEENIVGYYKDAAYPYNRHSFLYDGTNWTILDLPEDITGISGSNIIGNYFDINLRLDCGFLYDGTNFTTLAFPGASHTDVWGIDGDKIVGQYSASGIKHGFIATIPEPAVYYVDALDGNDDNDSLSPETPFATIQKAIDSAFDGDTVLVADGTYTGDSNRDIDFLGKAITLKSENGPENCIIDCNGTEAEHHRGFYFHNGEDGNSVLEGFTITDGYAWDGAGIYCLYSNPTITNCTINDNAAKLPSGNGGGICCYNSNPTITNCTITGNSAEGGGCGSGGGGGGIYFNRQSNPTITNCTICYNSAERDVSRGGGINCGGGSPTVTNCIISDNYAGGSGGGVYNCDGLIANCTITSNRSNVVGGGFFYCNGKITNCVITGNSATWGGGGIACCGGAITNCTITGNSAAGYGGAIYCYHSNPTISQCILWGNTATYGLEIALVGIDYPSHLVVSYNNVQGGQAAVYNAGPSTLNWSEGNIDVDPCFVEPGYWVNVNDPNIAVEPNDPNAIWVEGDYHLLRTSPCIDAASDANVYTDIEGNVRPFDFPGVDNNGELPEFDMGAYELVPVEAAMKFTPQTLNCRSKGKWVKAHLTLPEEFLPQDVDVNEPAMAEPIGIESEYIKVLGAGPVRLEICFDREVFCETITETDEVEITVIGSLTTSRYFYATNTIKMKPRR